jgi:GNAT superfamily N-acetyltransferase
MTDIRYAPVEDHEDKALEQVKRLFSDMYSHMDEHGLMLELDPDGAEKWMLSLKRTLGRFAVLQLACKGEQVIGFAHGSISLTPDYLGNKKIGVVTHIYVMPDYRSKKVATRLLDGLEDWFRDQQVHSIELQVLSQNLEAMNFWRKMGYKSELFQFRKLNP